MRTLKVVIVAGMLAGAINVASAGVTWKGIDWSEVAGSGASIAVDGSGNLVVTAGTFVDGPDYWGSAHINTPGSFRNAANPWVQVKFIDTGSGPGARLGLEDESLPDQAWTSFGTKSSRTSYYWYWWDVDADTDALTTLADRTASEHTLKVQAWADGSVDYWFDGSLVGHTTAAQVQWSYLGDVYLDAFTGASGESVTFTDFQMGDQEIPEPASLLVWSVIGGLGIGGVWWRRKRNAV